MMFNMAQSAFRNFVIGVDTQIPLRNGKWVTSINFDNAATTPPFIQTLHEIINFAPMYSSVHRSTGFKSELSTKLFETTRLIVSNFVQADPCYDNVIFVKNTTEAINKLSFRLLEPNEKSVVLSTNMEHHSNDLPWRNKYYVDYVEIDEDGRLRLDDLENKLIRFKGAVKLVTVTWASNVTGYINPIYEIAEIAHSHNAKILVDGAQIASHVPVDMKPRNSPQHIDYLAFSAHKMYAPFGTGVLIGPAETFKKGSPEYVGGGTVRTVTRNNVIWDDPPSKEEAGTPNVMGVVALQAAIKTLSMIGLHNIHKYEIGLWNYTVEKLKGIPGIRLYCDTNANKPRTGIIPFNIEGIHHSVVADILAREAGITVRNGCFCAQPYVCRLLKVTPMETETDLKDCRSSRPGMVRISFGLYNDCNEINVLIQTLAHIAEYKDCYIQRYIR